MVYQSLFQVGKVKLAVFQSDWPILAAFCLPARVPC